ncbi:MAG: M3 family metallopeptidase [Planctomycetota bacterium]
MSTGTEDLTIDNPFATASKLPFETPPFDRIDDAHYLPAFEAGMREHLSAVRDIATQDAPATFANTIEALERSGDLLERVANTFFNLTGSNTNDAMQKVQAEVAPKLAAHRDAIWLNRDLFARVEAVFGQRTELDPEQARLTERYHAAHLRAGARLDDAQQQRVREINERMSGLTTSFQEKLLAETKALSVLVDTPEELDGLDAGAIASAASAAKEAGHEGQLLLPLQLPTSQGVLSSLNHRGTRQRVFEASRSRCSRGGDNDTREIVRELCSLRAERAAILGHATHAHYVLDDETAKTPDAVRDMLARMTPAIVDKTKAEAAELQALFAELHPGETLEAWDWAWTAERLRQQRYDLDDGAVRQHFELEQVLTNGLFFMAEQLYGVQLKERKDLPTYHEDVRVFEVFDEGGESIALYYADLYARPNKRGGAWMSSFVGQSQLLSQKPVVVNVMNINKPADDGPTLMSFDEVTTLFHEFGHGVHGMLSHVTYPMLAGTNVPRDFVEFPSQFHEDFAFDDAVLERCARHHETGAPLAPEMVERIAKARRFGQGFASLEYIAAAWLDLAWHSVAPGTEVADVEAFEAAALAEHGVAMNLVPPRYRSAYFAHIWPGGYSAGYYAYLWSEALAADGFAACVENGGMTRENGQRFREHVLSRGLTLEPLDMFRAFRGRELDPMPLLRRRGLT